MPYVRCENKTNLLGVLHHTVQKISTDTATSLLFSFFKSLRTQHKILALDNQNTACLLSCCHWSTLVFQATHILGEKKKKVKSLRTSKMCCFCLKGRTALKHLRSKKGRERAREKFWRRTVGGT